MESPPEAFLNLEALAKRLAKRDSVKISPIGPIGPIGPMTNDHQIPMVVSC